jgi:thiosulfate/3-mercaptopyruvate sulfurtransferase
MAGRLLISAKELRWFQPDNGLVIFDCRFILDKPDAAYEEYLESHIPGALYAHLDDDLSGPVTSSSGRHPLPDASRFATTGMQN